MATINLKSEDFASTIEKGGIVLLDFWAEWCGPCKTFAPVFEAASARHNDVIFAKVNTEEEAQLAGSFGISAIPTLMVFRDGVGVFSQPGMIPAAGLDQLIEEVKKLDMDEVRSQIARQGEQQHQASA